MVVQAGWWWHRLINSRRHWGRTEGWNDSHWVVGDYRTSQLDAHRLRGRARRLARVEAGVGGARVVHEQSVRDAVAVALRHRLVLCIWSLDVCIYLQWVYSTHFWRPWRQSLYCLSAIEYCMIVWYLCPPTSHHSFTMFSILRDDIFYLTSLSANCTVQVIANVEAGVRKLGPLISLLPSAKVKIEYFNAHSFVTVHPRFVRIC